MLLPPGATQGCHRPSTTSKSILVFSAFQGGNRQENRRLENIIITGNHATTTVRATGSCCYDQGRSSRTAAYCSRSIGSRDHGQPVLGRDLATLHPFAFPPDDHHHAFLGGAYRKLSSMPPSLDPSIFSASEYEPICPNTSTVTELAVPLEFQNCIQYLELHLSLIVLVFFSYSTFANGGLKCPVRVSQLGNYAL